MSNHHLTVKQLSERWDLSTGTLDHWRRYGKGPLFMKIGGHVLYRLSDIEAYEEAVISFVRRLTLTFRPGHLLKNKKPQNPDRVIASIF